MTNPAGLRLDDQSWLETFNTSLIYRTGGYEKACQKIKSANKKKNISLIVMILVAPIFLALKLCVETKYKIADLNKKIAIAAAGTLALAFFFWRKFSNKMLVRDHTYEQTKERYTQTKILISIWNDRNHKQKFASFLHSLSNTNQVFSEGNLDKAATVFKSFGDLNKEHSGDVKDTFLDRYYVQPIKKLAENLGFDKYKDDVPKEIITFARTIDKIVIS